jgi:hypothetical protein
MSVRTWSKPGLLLAAILVLARLLAAQSAPETDLLILSNGDQVTGQLLSATDTAVTFRGTAAGNITIPWSKVKEIRSSRSFAAIRKGLVLTSGADRSQVPQGLLSLKDQQLEIRSDPQSPPVAIPLADLSSLIGDKAFADAFQRKKLLSSWSGSASTGVALIQSTQDFRSVSFDFHAARNDPEEAWIRQRSRTLLHFQNVSGETKSAEAVVKISVVNAMAEYDHYLTPRIYLFGMASFEHNYSQGLDLRQSYGGGPGFVLLRSERQTWEAWAALRFSNQDFADATLNRKIFGARIGQTYTRKFANGMVFFEQAGIAPGFTDKKSYFAGYSTSLTLPVYRRLSVVISSWDQYINDAPPGFKKNTLQLSIGANYTF